MKPLNPSTPLPGLCFVFILSFLGACSPKITTTIDVPAYATAGQALEIAVYEEDQQVPEKALEIGTVEIGERAFTTDCGWQTVLNNAVREVRKAGGNALRITRHIQPRTGGSTCHQLTGKILRIEESAYRAQIGQQYATDSAARQLRITQTLEAQHELINIPPASRYSIGFNGGISRLSSGPGGGTPDFLRSYIRELTIGVHVGAQAAWYFRESFGVGLKYAHFNTSNSFGGQIVITDQATGKERIGSLSDNIRTNYYAPAFCARFMNRKKTVHFNGDLSIGYVTYRNDAVLVDSYRLTGNAFAWAADFSIDLLLREHLAFTPGITFFNANMDQYTFSQGGIKTSLSSHPYLSSGISRFDFHIGVRLHW